MGECEVKCFGGHWVCESSIQSIYSQLTFMCTTECWLCFYKCCTGQV